jgi:hypothetical protein
MNSVLKKSIVFHLALMLAFLLLYVPRADALIFYDQTLDSGGEVQTGLGPNPGNDPKYQIVGSFVVTEDIDLGTGTTSILFSAHNSTPGVSFNAAIATSTNDPLLPTGFPTIIAFNNIDLGNDGVTRSTVADSPPSQCGAGLCQLRAGDTVYILIYSTQGISFSTQYVITDSADSDFYGQLTFNETPPGPSNTTRIITVEPSDDETIATSTTATIGATGYINDDDFQNGMFVRMIYLQQSSNQASVANPYNLGTTIDFPIDVPGAFSVSTSTSITRAGVYIMQSSIRTTSVFSNVLNFMGFGQFANQGIKTSTSTRFIADHQTAFDVLVGSTTQAIDDYIASSTISLSACTGWTQFNLIDCLNLMLIPQPIPIYQALTDFKDGFLSLFPWGYVTRFVVILSGNATTTMPVMVTYIPDPTNPTVMLPYTFDPNEALVGAGVLIDGIRTPGSDKTVRESMEDIVNAVVAGVVITYIVYDMLRVGKNKTQHSVRTKLS